MDRFDPFVKYSDIYGDVVNWEKDPMNKPQNQNKYFFSDGKTYYEQICKMLKLMSVFKDAFNQIYDNEDEISSAWQNFIDNLSATAVAGEEAGVRLTWTDTSVNFAFTIPGGEDGVGISSITFNSDYTMTITLTNGQTYTSTSLRGPQGVQGEQGPQGEPGAGLELLDVYTTLQELQTAHPTGTPGDAYQVGTAPSFTLYIWSASRNQWVPAGTLGSVSPSVTPPLMDGTASPGSSDLYSRGDHVHPTDTSRASVTDLNDLSNDVTNIKTQIGSESTTPMTGILGRVNTLESNVTDLETAIGSDATSPMTGLAGRIKTIENALNNLKGKVVYEYTSTSTDQGLTTAQLDMSDLNNATHIEVIYSHVLNGNTTLSTGIIPYKFYDPSSVAIACTINNNQMDQNRERSWGISSTGLLTINSCRTYYPDTPREVTNSYLIIRQVILYKFTRANSLI